MPRDSALALAFPASLAKMNLWVNHVATTLRYCPHATALLIPSRTIVCNTESVFEVPVAAIAGAWVHRELKTPATSRIRVQ